MNLTYFQLNSDKCAKYKLSKIGIFLMGRTANLPGGKKTGENEVIQLIDHFDVDPQCAYQGMRGTVEVVEMNGRVYGGEEGTVKPATSL
jgi:hypothetical protein